MRLALLAHRSLVRGQRALKPLHLNALCPREHPGIPGETQEETVPNGAKEVGVGRGLGQRPSWLARKPLIRRHTQPCRDDPRLLS